MGTYPPITTAPKALPLLGHVIPLAMHPLTFMASLPAYGDLVKMRLGPMEMVVICDPDLTHQVLLDDKKFDKGGRIYDRAREVMGKGLLTCPYRDHRRQRRLAQPAFHPARLRVYASVMTTCIVDTIESWHDGQILDIPRQMATITGKVAADTLFSVKRPGVTLDDMTVIVDSVFRRMLLPPPLDRLPLPGNIAYRRALSRLQRMVLDIIADRRASDMDHGDLLSALLSAQDPESGGSGLTDDEITDTVLGFVLAGTETTATTLSWALYEISRNPGIEQRLHNEVDSVLSHRPATHADLPQLELTGRIITETLRKYAPVWFSSRTVTTATQLGRYFLPAGTTLVFSPHLIHYRQDLYENPGIFDPDRWDTRYRTPPPRHALLPFGAGARKCIGDVFGVTEAVLALATIVGRWHLESLSGHDPRAALGTIARPNQLSMRATRRV